MQSEHNSAHDPICGALHVCDLACKSAVTIASNLLCSLLLLLLLLLLHQQLSLLRKQLINVKAHTLGHSARVLLMMYLNI
jgi:hypothetical protein